MNAGVRRPLVWPAILVAWLAAAVLVYAVFHKGFDLAFVLQLGRLLLALLAAGIVVSLAGGVGRRLLPTSIARPSIRCSIQAALGTGLLSLAVFLLGLLQGFRPELLAAVTVLGLILLRTSVVDWWRSIRRAADEVRGVPRFGQVLLGLSLVWLVFTLAEALAAPAHFDALVYHLALPFRFLQAGGIVWVPENPFWGSPWGMEMLYALAGGLSGTTGAAVVGWCIGVLALLGIFGLGEELWKGGGAVAVAALLAGETIASSLGWAYSDWGAALYGVALLGMLQSDATDGPTAGLVVGLLAGFAVGAKLTAVPVALAALVVLVWPGRSRRPFRTAALFLGGFVLAVAPWFGKNLIATGALFYPFSGANPFVSDLRQADYRAAARALSPIEAIFVPVLATVRGVEAAPGFAASVGPVMLGLFPAALLPRGEFSRRLMLPALVSFVVGWLAWSVSSLWSPLLAQSRLHFAWFPAWAFLASAGFGKLSQLRIGRVRFHALAASLVLLSLGLSLVWGARQFGRSHPLALLMGLESDGAYAVRRLGAYGPAMDLLAQLPPGSRVLMLWEPRSLACQPRCLPDAWLDRWLNDRRVWGDPDAIVAAWRGQGITHVLIFDAGAEFVRADGDPRYRVEDWDGLRSLRDGLLAMERIGSAYSLYRINP